MKTKSTVLICISIIFYICAIVMISKGYNKVSKYYLSERYPDLNVNAYVGGDAYNYIINSNYATGYYVLSTGFFLAGVILDGFAVLISVIPEAPYTIRVPEGLALAGASSNKEILSPDQEKQKEDEEELPEL